MDTRPSGRSGPVLVTGSHRSGSTWVGAVLALAPGAGYLHEPFNTRTRKGVCDVSFPTDLTYVTRENETPYVGPLRDTLDWRYALAAETRRLRTPRDLARMLRDFAYFETMRRRGARPIMKDPLALFSAEWLSERFDMPVVVIIRHPAAFAASLMAVGWVKFPFRVLRDQESLMRERLAPFRDEVAAAAAGRPEPLDVAVLLWRTMHHHIRLLRRDHPDWIFVRHEDLSLDPAAGFRAIYARLGLDFSTGAEAGVGAYCGTGGPLAKLSLFGVRRAVVRDSRANVRAWRNRLTPAQVEAVRIGAADVWPDFYAEADW